VSGCAAGDGPWSGPGLALYVHLPWCVRKCPYCDFNSHQLKSRRPDGAYIDSLIADLDGELPLVQSRRIDTVFFGGGTPSLFPPEDYARLLHAVRQRIDVAADAEVTLEANPGTLERGRFSGYREAGINRVSLGAQTFSPRALERLGRIHTAEDTLRAVSELREAGIRNFNLDLMYALPEQTIEEAIADVRSACELEPSHISYYQLTLEPGTVFHARRPALPDEEAAWRMQCEGQSFLAASGYAQYEVSAYAREGFRCRHNLNYWLFGDYLGLGAGAHGKLTLAPPDKILRTAKPRQPRDYEAMAAGTSQPGGERRFVAPADLAFEFMLGALRLNEGFSVDCFESRTGLPAAALEHTMEKSRRLALVQATSVGWMPTSLGRRFLNDLQAMFLS